MSHGEWDGLVVMCAASSWDSVKMMDRHLAERLCRTTPVLYVDPPISHLTPFRRPELAGALARPRLRRLGPSLMRLTPVVLPGPERPGMAALTTSLVRRSLRRLVDRLGVRPRAVVAVSSTIHTFGACGEGLKVYWAQDDFVAGARMFGLSPGRVRRGAFRMAATADVIVAANPVVAQAWRAEGFDPVLIPYGCDSEHFQACDQAALPADVDLPPPVAGFIGTIGERIDFRLLEAIADRGVSLLLVGPRHPQLPPGRLRDLAGRPNVRWVGKKAFEDLPSYMRVLDVGLVPYTDDAFNRGSFPLKTLEYLAAGRAVVATDLPATRWLDTPLIAIACGPEAFTQAAISALEQRRAPALVRRRRAVAARHSWSARTLDFARVLGVDAGARLVPEAALN